MNKNKFKYWVIILALCIANNPLKAFANTTNGSSSSNGNTTILEGEIGEWDPNIQDKPNFGDGTDIEGNIPTVDQYFTISVTVPLDMEFMVLPSSNLAFGSFYSPKYTIKNNGSKTIIARINSFDIDTTITTANETPLYVEKIVPGDGRTQMELNICTLDETIFNDIDKEIDLTNLNTLSDEERTLYELQANEVKKVKFNSRKWEIPKYESQKEIAKSSYEAVFEFSIKKD